MKYTNLSCISVRYDRWYPVDSIEVQPSTGFGGARTAIMRGRKRKKAEAVAAAKEAKRLEDEARAKVEEAIKSAAVTTTKRGRKTKQVEHAPPPPKKKCKKVVDVEEQNADDVPSWVCMECMEVRSLASMATAFCIPLTSPPLRLASLVTDRGHRGP